jgi:hypothetical protein
MSLTQLVRQEFFTETTMNHITASDVFRPAEKIANGISEYEREQQSFRANYERLKTERQAREADQDRR